MTTSNLIPLENRYLRMYNCILSYPTLFVPRIPGKAGANREGKPRYGASFILPELTPAEENILATVYQETLATKWTPQKTPNLQGDRTPFTTSPEYPGRRVVKANRRQEDGPVPVFDQQEREMHEDRATEIFAGCIVTATIQMYAYTQPVNGVTASLAGIQLMRNTDVRRLDNHMDARTALGLGPAVDGGAGAPATPGLPGLPDAKAPPVGPGGAPSWMD